MAVAAKIPIRLMNTVGMKPPSAVHQRRPAWRRFPEVPGIVGAGPPGQRPGGHYRVAQQERRPALGSRKLGRLVGEIGRLHDKHGERHEGDGERGREIRRGRHDRGVAVDAQHEAKERNNQKHDPLDSRGHGQAQHVEQRQRCECRDHDVDHLVKQPDDQALARTEHPVASDPEHRPHDGDARCSGGRSTDRKPADGDPPQVPDDRDDDGFPHRKADEYQQAAKGKRQVVDATAHPDPEQLERASMALRPRNEVQPPGLDVAGPVGVFKGFARGGGMAGRLGFPIHVAPLR